MAGLGAVKVDGVGLGRPARRREWGRVHVQVHAVGTNARLLTCLPVLSLTLKDQPVVPTVKVPNLLMFRQEGPSFWCVTFTP